MPKGSSTFWKLTDIHCWLKVRCPLEQGYWYSRFSLVYLASEDAVIRLPHLSMKQYKDHSPPKVS